ncbi:aldolase/citrate lyase family protein [Clostridium sp. AM58-1XD]|uniref:HpcH/HpaI aldolase family protein n=1 Tax=Clostridium sp. AM58-1XD TaxID=2292307 RepID=UPI000E52D389|nr:aldolase/citrate lyase family protein [Clostridium sp. AM58-1XD]RGY99246.1 hypothetical protein DXA13_08465 [Clostridium sp. AM58-1XD]
MKFQFQNNQIWNTIRSGKPAIGTQLYTICPSIVEILAYNDWDYVMLDMEHTLINKETLANLVRTADAAGITTLVRPPQNDLEYYIRYICESGAQGIIAPHMKCREDVKRILNWMHYPPNGEMGMCPANRAARYCYSSWNDYVKANDDLMLCALIEDVEAADNIEEILAELKPGRDIIWFGRGDFAMSVLKFHPELENDLDSGIMKEYQKKITEAAIRAHIPVMSMPYGYCSAESAQEQLEIGSKIVMWSVDQLVLSDYFGKVASDIKGKQHS